MMRAAILCLGACLCVGAEDSADLVQIAMKGAKHSPSFREVFDSISPRSQTGQRSSTEIAAKFVAELVEAGHDQKITPEVDDTIKQLIKSIDTDIIYHIQQDHNGTQAKIYYLLALLDNRTQVAVKRYNQSKVGDGNWYNCVGPHTENGTEKHLCTKAHNCSCGPEPACYPVESVYSWTIPKPRQVLNCELKKEHDCSTNLSSWRSNLSAWIQEEVEITNPISQLNLDKASYEIAYNNCNASRVACTTKNDQCDEDEQTWYNKRENCQNKYAKRQVGICKFGDSYQNKCEAKAAYDELIVQVETTKGTVYSDPDRRNEYEVAKLIQCLLQTYLDSGSLDSSTLSTCSGEQDDFNEIVGQLDYGTPLYSLLISAHNFSCNESAVTFYNGEQWNIPAGGLGNVPACTNYTLASEGFSPVITANTSKPAFTFCAVGETGNTCDDEGFDQSTCPDGSTYSGSTVCQLDSNTGCTVADCCTGWTLLLGKKDHEKKHHHHAHHNVADM